MRSGAAVFSWLAGLVAIVFVVIAALTPLTLNVESVLFDPRAYKEALRRQQVYQHLPELAAAQIVYSLNDTGCFYAPHQCQVNPYQSASPALLTCLQNTLGMSAYEPLSEGQRPASDNEIAIISACLDQFEPPSSQEANPNGLPASLRQLSAADWQRIFAALLPADWLQRSAESLLDQLFAYLDSYNEHLSLKISLTELKTRLAGSAGLTALQQILSAYPPCTPDQLVLLAQALPAEAAKPISLCNPPEALWSSYQPQIQAAVAQIVARLPDETDLASPSGKSSSSNPSGRDFRAVIQNLRAGVHLTPLLAVALLALVTVLAVRSLPGWLEWWGIPLLAAGLLGGSLALATPPAVEHLLTIYGVPPLRRLLAPDVIQTTQELIRSLIRAAALHSGLESAALALLGVALTSASFAVERLLSSVTSR